MQKTLGNYSVLIGSISAMVSAGMLWGGFGVGVVAGLLAVITVGFDSVIEEIRKGKS